MLFNGGGPSRKSQAQFLKDDSLLWSPIENKDGELCSCCRDKKGKRR